MAKEYEWLVIAPGYEGVQVKAPDEGGAIMAAAERWGVAFAKVAGLCDCIRGREVKPILCARCKKAPVRVAGAICDTCHRRSLQPAPKMQRVDRRVQRHGE